MKYVITLACLLLFSMSAVANTVPFELSISLDGQNGDLDMLIHEAQEQGWDIQSSEYDDYIIIINGEIDLANLPFQLMTSGPSIHVSRDPKSPGMYKVEMDYTVGDYDSSISAETLTNGVVPTYLMMSGGDHSGGSWGISATLKLQGI